MKSVRRFLSAPSVMACPRALYCVSCFESVTSIGTRRLSDEHAVHSDRRPTYGFPLLNWPTTQWRRKTDIQRWMKQSARERTENSKSSALVIRLRVRGRLSLLLHGLA